MDGICVDLRRYNMQRKLKNKEKYTKYFCEDFKRFNY